MNKLTVISTRCPMSARIDQSQRTLMFSQAALVLSLPLRKSARSDTCSSMIQRENIKEFEKYQ